MATLAEQITTLGTQVSNLQAMVQGVRYPGLFYAMLGNHVIFGCKITEGYSAADMVLALEGEASGDPAHLNPDGLSPATRPEQYFNIANIYGEVFLSESKNVSTLQDAALTIATAPGAGYHRYDIVYGYVTSAGPAVAIAAGTAVLNASTPSDPTIPTGAERLARVHVEASVTGIADAKITDLRNFSGRLAGGSSASWQIEAAAGTADAITATFTPPLTLTDKAKCAVVLAGANATTTPTFAPDGLTAHTITKLGGQALRAGDLPGAKAVALLEYDATNTRWELLNPAYGASDGLKQDVSGKDATGGYAGLTLFKINFKNVANTFISFFTNSNTAARTYTFQDKDGTVAHTSDTHDATGKTTPVDADELPITDSAATYVLKKLTWANLKTTLASTFAALAGSASQDFATKKLTAADVINNAMASDPATPATGDLWFNSTERRFKGALALNVWSAMASLNTGRIGAAAGGTAFDALTFAGASATVSYMVSTELFDGITWSARNNMATARYVLAGCGQHSSAVLSFGGDDGSRKTTTEYYNGAVWAAGGALNTARSGLSGAGSSTSAVSFGGDKGGYANNTETYNGSAWTNSGNMIEAVGELAGCGTGVDALCLGGNNGGYIATVERFNGATWTAGGSMNVARRYGAGAGTASDALAFGGYPGPADSTERYNGTTWATGGTMSTTKYVGSGAGTANNGLSVGGLSGGNYLATAERYSANLASAAPNAWYGAGHMLTARGYIAGTGTATDALNFGSGTTTERYNGIAWTAGGALGTSRGGLAGAGTASAALSFGGDTGSVSAVTESYNGATWTAGGALATARSYLGGAGSASDALSFGGLSGSPLTTTERYNGATWSAGGALGTARYQLAGAGTASDALSFGGDTGSVSAVTSRYNGSTWTSGGALATARSVLGGAGTASDALSFGGWNGSSALGTTERYNGSTWSSGGALAHSRRTLAGAGSASDALSFGGYDSGYLAATERYNGSSTAAPTRRIVSFSFA